MARRSKRRLSDSKLAYWAKVDERVKLRFDVPSLTDYVTERVCEEGESLIKVAARIGVEYGGLYGYLIHVKGAPLKRGSRWDKLARELGFADFNGYINDRYWDREQSLRDLEEETGRTGQAILNQMKNRGIKRRTLSEAAECLKKAKARNKEQA
jgi:hypothetical protein